MFLELTPSVKKSTLSQAVQALLTHHDALRLRFERQGRTQASGGSWQQMIVAPSPFLPFEVIELGEQNEQVAIFDNR